MASFKKIVGADYAVLHVDAHPTPPMQPWNFLLKAHVSWLTKGSMFLGPKSTFSAGFLASSIKFLSFYPTLVSQFVILEQCKAEHEFNNNFVHSIPDFTKKGAVHNLGLENA